MSSNPLVSVIIPCFNQGRFLSEALASVWSQTYSNIEVIVVDDGSTADAATNVIAELKEQPVAVRFYQHQVRRGAAAARNLAIKHSQGELILPLDADDFLAADYLEKTVNVLRDPAFACVYTDMQLFGDQSFLHKPNISLVTALSGDPIPVCTLYRRQVYDAVGGYKEHLDIGEDTDFAIRVLRLGFQYAYIEEPLYFYRKHAPSTSTQYTGGGSIETVQNIYSEHKDLLLEHLPEILFLKETRYCKLQQEYAHLHTEFHKLLRYTERELSKEIGVRNTFSLLLKSLNSYLDRI